MDTHLSFGDAATLHTPMLTVFAVDIAVGPDADPLPALLTTSSAITEAASRFLTSGEFKAKLAETLLLHAPNGLRAERLLIIGLGKATTLSAVHVRKGAGTAVRFAKHRTLREVVIAFPEDHALSDEHLDVLPCKLIAQSIIEGAELAEPDWHTYRSKQEDKSIRTLVLVAPDGERTTTAEIQEGFDEGLIVAGAQNFARNLINEPCNVLTPTELGRRAKAMCEEVGVASEIYSTEKLIELGMGAFAAVSQGSAQPPALIVMTYTPEGITGGSGPVLGLVGKGITFDTGGISLKSADGMEKMKADMSGSAAVVGAMRAIAQLKPRVKVIAIVCSAENMPDGNAFRPGDVVTAMSGKTIEIINTDAEGRLVLADGLHYAKTLGCTHLVDVATLTGACGVALGQHFAGLFSNDETTWHKFQGAADLAGEKFWRLPLAEEYREQIKSNIADMINAGGRPGGAATAAALLHEFAGDTPWIHLDIAACAWNDEVKPWLPKGPIGVTLRSMVQWVRSYES